MNIEADGPADQEEVMKEKISTSDNAFKNAIQNLEDSDDYWNLFGAPNLQSVSIVHYFLLSFEFIDPNK